MFDKRKPLGTRDEQIHPDKPEVSHPNIYWERCKVHCYPHCIPVSSGNVLGTAILIVVVLPTLLVARSYRDTVEFDFERAQIIVTRSLLWYIVLHTRVYTFRDLLSMKYSLDADFWGTITMSFADGTTQVIQPFPYAKEPFEFLRAKISRSQ